ncbi:HTH-type transcriptional regulator PuuR [Sinobacterium norvegicum]|uniref:HTH-type transcriptional regulator PuuR n=1 Tax=Sinobacterium norvegicum TaxID=1641715 RepID=A0ABN8EC65_9GAMM|nr:cupin domain-containing protein [Sinobacterium norvegicum]CAH0990081.1 HTH-type transcriptional regulator PuuR [Sinobacterium norvegicum]
MDIGERLKNIRKDYGYSQRELAKRVGVTNSTISLIEQNRVSPSVGSLKKVLDGIPMSLADFFAVDAGEKDQQFFYQSNDLPDLGTEGIQYLLVGANRNDRQMSIMREVYIAGSDTGEELLSHDGEEGGFIVQGQLELTVDGDVQLLSEGDGYYFDSRKPHRFRNIGEQDCEVVSANTPPSF